MGTSEVITSAPSVYGLKDPVEIATAKALFLARADELKVKSAVSKVFSECEREAKEKRLAVTRNSNKAEIELNNGTMNIEFDAKGVPLQTISNFAAIMLFDKFYDNIRYNILGNYAERHVVDSIHNTFEIKKWNDAEEAKSRNYIEEKYHIYSERKHADALRILFDERSYNPVMDMINTFEWDGVDRCEEFLTKWAGADDTPYVRECSRLIFAGGIWRMMLPGCKMDDVIVLWGKQGNGKSSLVRFLAINDEYFGEIKTVDGAPATEQLAGKWICEIPELSAFTKAKEVEAVKAFITRQKDSYRKPYDRNVDDRPRRCIFIGTTNNPHFLTDLTGNRRFYPVESRSNGYDLFEHEAECREYIAQCWAEALEKYKKKQMPNFARRDLVDEYREAQENATIDDWRIGAIKAYLDDKPIGSFVCIKELMSEVVSPDIEHPQNPNPKDSKDLGIIMSKFDDWEKTRSAHRTAKYGGQRGWVKIAESKPEYEEPNLPSEDEIAALPF